VARGVLKQDFNLVGTGTTESTVNTFGANYTMGAAKLMGLYQTNTNGLARAASGAVNNSAMSISGTYTMGAVVLMAQLGELTNSAAAADTKSKFTGIGADYNLSKMTAIYLRAESVDDKAGIVQGALTPATIKGAGTTFARTAVGVRIGF